MHLQEVRHPEKEAGLLMKTKESRMESGNSTRKGQTEAAGKKQDTVAGEDAIRRWESTWPIEKKRQQEDKSSGTGLHTQLLWETEGWRGKRHRVKPKYRLCVRMAFGVPSSSWPDQPCLVGSHCDKSAPTEPGNKAAAITGPGGYSAKYPRGTTVGAPASLVVASEMHLQEVQCPEKEAGPLKMTKESRPQSGNGMRKGQMEAAGKEQGTIAGEDTVRRQSQHGPSRRRGSRRTNLPTTFRHVPGGTWLSHIKDRIRGSYGKPRGRGMSGEGKAQMSMVRADRI
ncbi:hypothetical protein NDU88_005119 [Pleurodeles waltl]|uniref:Uncharacterized protein n=1 Tax=Pleurodeles waltl TaxID=8319 RepID=A0AAV7WXL9_PLEWA|nr:hypothetical protein NDU88_005119 [Pleurodeles waltl]